MRKKIEVFPDGSLIFIEGNITARIGKQKPDVVVDLDELDGVSEDDFHKALHNRGQFKTLRKRIEDKAKLKAQKKRADKLKGLQSKQALDIIGGEEQPLTNLEEAVAESE